MTKSEWLMSIYNSTSAGQQKRMEPLEKRIKQLEKRIAELENK